MKQAIKSMICWTLVFVIITLSWPGQPLAAASVPSGGYWKLERYEDEEPRDYVSPGDAGYEGWVDYIYDRNNFAFDWETSWNEDGNDYISSGRVSAAITGLPDKILPNQPVTLTANLESSASTNYEDLSGYTDSYPPSAWIKLAGYAQTSDGTYEYSYELPGSPFGAPFSDQHAVTFALPDGSAYSDQSFWIECGLSNPADMTSLRTTSYYTWVPGTAVVQSPPAIELKGLVRSVENKPMPWQKLTAIVYKGTNTYNGSQPYDTYIEGQTDHLGRYALTIPLEPEDASAPVGILLTATMTCQYPHEPGKKAFTFIDMADPVSQVSNEISVATWLTVEPQMMSDPDRPGEPIRVNRLLAYYNLGLGAFSFSPDMMPDPLIPYSQDVNDAQNQQNFSYLYTAAYDAWFFGAAVLNEDSALLSLPPRIELRWTPPANALTTSSHYSQTDNTIRLTAPDSLRDDNSRFTILHEFGHAFDCISNGGTTLRAQAGYAAGDSNHGGYFNATTADSQLEGFATFFAAMVQLFGGYPNPHVCDWIILDSPSRYKAWDNLGTAEEFAVSSVLYKAHPLIGDISSLWNVLKPDRNTFYDYYQALNQVLSAQSPDLATQLDDYTFDAGLFRMPFGNGQYDPGEPFQDLPDASNQKNGQLDPGELFGDLMYAVGADGQIDFGQTLQPLPRQAAVIGASGDALRNTRQSIHKPRNAYLDVQGESVDYLLVTVREDNGSTYRQLRSVINGKVFIGLPEQPMTGSLEAAVPGGSVVYTQDLAALQEHQKSTFDQPIPADFVTIEASDLAPEGILIGATYGEESASGLITIPAMSETELATLSDEYDLLASYEQIQFELANRGGQGGQNGGDGEGGHSSGDGSNGGTPGGFFDDVKNLFGMSQVLKTLVAAGIVAFVGWLLLRRKRRTRTQQSDKPAITVPNQFCRNCGSPVNPDSKFCRNCGQKR